MKTIQPLDSAPEVPDEPAKPTKNDEIIELNDAIDGPIDDKLADLLEASESDSQSADPQPDPTPDTAVEPAADDVGHDEAPEPDSGNDDGIVDDKELESAIDDIVAEESDKVLAAEDGVLAASQAAAKPSKPESKLGSFLRAVWANPKSRWGVLGGTTVLLLVIALVPNSRYFVLNTARVRSGLELKVIDSSTLQPLKNVTVRAGGAEALTGSDGVAKLTGVRLGRTKLTVEKRAFAAYTRDVTVGWGSNPMGDVQVQAVGTQYTFYVKDFLSGKPIQMAEAASGEGNASSDQDGKIVLTMDTVNQDDAAQLSIQISATDYRTETLNITVNNKEKQDIEMVPSRRPTFITKRSGTYDLYGIDADGKNERRLVGGTSLERDDMVIVPHPTKNVVAYIATRENTRNQSGYLLSTLYIVNTDSGDIMKIDQSEQIQIIGWSRGGRLVYVKVAAGASGTDPKRHRLISFNNDDYTDVKELASSNSFNDVIMANDKVYFAPSNMFNESSAPATYVINTDGTEQSQILDREVFAIVRSGYDTLYLSAGPTWFSYKLGATAEESESPSSTTGRIYADSPDGKSGVYVDNRDGQGVLISYDKATGKETELYARGGLKLPVYWLNQKYIVFRISDGKETADYVLNVEGGEPRKVTNVTATAGIDRWFYY